MKIFYFSDSKLPSQNAQSVHCMKMAAAFVKAGHDVTLFARGDSGVEESEIFQAYNTAQNFTLALSSFMYFPLLSDAARLADITSKIRRESKPDLIYGSDCFSLCLFGSNTAGIIYEAHELPEHGAKSWAFARMIRQANFKGIVATSDVLKKDLLEHYPLLRPQSIFVAHDGAEFMEQMTIETQTPAALNGRKDAFAVGYIGSLHAGKGIDLIAEIAEMRPDYDFHIIGGTERHIHRASNAYNIANLYFHGHRDHAQIPSYLAAFDVVLAPYQHHSIITMGKNMMRWLSPIKIFEYMASAKAMICSDLPILHEILEHERNALLLPSGDVMVWAKALDKLRNNPDVAKILGQNAYLHLKENYTWDKRAAAILDFCKETPEVFKQAKAS